MAFRIATLFFFICWYAQITRFYGFTGEIHTVCKTDDNDASGEEEHFWQMGNSRAFPFLSVAVVSGILTPRAHSTIHWIYTRRYTYTFSVEYCQNGCQNEIWNGSLMAVARISPNHLVYEYHDGYIDQKNFSSSFFLQTHTLSLRWLFHPNQLPYKNLFKRRDRYERCESNETRGYTRHSWCKQKLQPTVSMEMFYLFSIILFTYTVSCSQTTTECKWTE